MTKGRVFVSHSSKDDIIVDKIVEFIKIYKIDMFVDHLSIKLTDRWHRKVNEALDECSQMIAVISPESIDSENCIDEWYNFISTKKEIIPVWIRGNKMWFSLSNIQYIDIRDSDDFEPKMVKLVEYLTDGQPSVPQPFTDTGSTIPKSTTATDVRLKAELHSQYPITGLMNKSVGVATGDIARHAGIDVLVNSENDLLRMDPGFGKTVSAALNAYGARRDESGQEIEWVIERELEAERKRLKLPAKVPAATVVTTSPGTLSNNRIRYIMHSVSVIGDLTNGFRPVTDVKLRMCVNNVLMKCNELNIEKYDEDDYRPIQTVMFPVFATGNGGKDFSEAARLMVERTLEFFYYHPHTLIQTVYFVAFNQEKLDKLLTILNSIPDLLPPIRE